MADKPSFEQALIGQTLAGKYRLVEVQGAGFYSVVFVAHQHFCNRFVRPVALKVSRLTGLTEGREPAGDATCRVALTQTPPARIAGRAS
jgi:hypothetical protein